MASPRGQVVEREDETELTYHDAVRNHYISGIATVEFAAGQREQLLRSFHQAKLDAIRLGREHGRQGYRGARRSRRRYPA